MTNIEIFRKVHEKMGYSTTQIDLMIKGFFGENYIESINSDDDLYVLKSYLISEYFAKHFFGEKDIIHCVYKFINGDIINDTMINTYQYHQHNMVLLKSTKDILRYIKLFL